MPGIQLKTKKEKTAVMLGKEETMPIKPISAEELYFKPFKSLPALVEGIIPKGMTVLAGSSKIGKSWMAPEFGKCFC
jgi:hypothetical protein